MHKKIKLLESMKKAMSDSKKFEYVENAVVKEYCKGVIELFDSALAFCLESVNDSDEDLWKWLDDLDDELLKKYEKVNRALTMVKEDSNDGISIVNDKTGRMELVIVDWFISVVMWAGRDILNKD